MNLLLAAMHLEASPRAVPLGPAMLAAVLNRAFGSRLTTQVLDLYLEQSAQACADAILEAQPQAVGFSMYLWNRTRILEIAQILKAQRPDLLILAGGAEATADFQGVLARPEIDLVLAGEAEELILVAAERLLLGQSAQEIQAALRPGPIQDLAALPSPFLDGTLDPRRYSGQLWELSRGCPFKCDFCFESRGTSGIRRIPMERAEAELKLFEACSVAQVFVLDPTFNFDRKRAKEVLRLIARTAPGIHFFFEIRSEFIDRELARLFASLKCTLQIGLQSADDRVLRNINRSLDQADFESKILLLHQAGATYGFDLIYGLPGDDLAGFRASLDFALALMPNHLDIFPLAVLPGTRLHETAASFELRHQPDNPYLVTSAPGFDAQAMAEAARLARACDVFYNEGKAVPWFAIVLNALEQPASELFEQFAGHLDRNPALTPMELQQGFVLQVFQERGQPAMGTVAADLATYFGLTGQLADKAANRCELAPAAGLSLNPDSCFGHFRHDPALLLAELAAGITELEDLSFVLPAAPCEAILFLRGEEPRIEVLTPAQAAWLKAVAAGEAAQGQDEFLTRMIAEGVLVNT